jgi:hypothetical protein
MTMLTITLPESQWALLRDYADAGLSDKRAWLEQADWTEVSDLADEQEEIEAATSALVSLIYALTPAQKDTTADNTNPALVEKAIRQYVCDEIDIDDNAVVSEADDGAWVQAWVWVAADSAEEVTA